MRCCCANRLAEASPNLCRRKAWSSKTGGDLKMSCTTFGSMLAASCCGSTSLNKGEMSGVSSDMMTKTEHVASRTALFIWF